MKKFIKSLIPPIVFNLLNQYRNRSYGWTGNYTTWKDAQKLSTGYENNEILQKVKKSLLKVKNGEAVYERDSVLFDEIQYSWPTLSGLMLAAANSNGSLRVLDFGGSLGSTYYQNKKFLDELTHVTWSVVEQKHFIDIGKQEFEDDRLRFYYNFSDCIESEQPNVLLISSVLQYIEKPYELMDELFKYNFEFVIFDRTIFSKRNESLITVQKIKDKSYSSIPCWLFGENDFLNKLKKYYLIIEDFNLPHEENERKYEKGYICKKI